MTENDPDSVQENANERRRERTQHVENILDETDTLFKDHKFPTTSEELATEYANERLDLPNETESLGSVFDRMTERREFESPEEVREALYGELTGHAETGGPGEYNEEREIQDLDENVQDEESNVNST